MKVLTVVGARPNFMKAAPIISAIHKHNASTWQSDTTVRIDHVLVHTGQHYDARMSDPFFADLQIPNPDIQLGVGSGSHSLQTAEILRKFEDVLLQHRPDVVIVVGDVNSTIACALATAKISFDAHGTRPILAHVEAGLRSYDRAMPEEINRVVTDHVSDLLFVTEPSGQKNLLAEGISRDTIVFVGNTMIDSLLASQDKADGSPILDRLGLRRTNTDASVTEYGLLTLHRPSNVDNPETFLKILAGLDEVAADHPLVFPVHPRTKQRILEFGLNGKIRAQIRSEDTIIGDSQNGFIMTEPLGYLDFLCLMKNAAIVVTDSGGIQEETTCLGVPCVTVRENTERPVTVDVGTNVIAGTSTQRIRSAIRESFGRKSAGRMPERWDGHAAERIVERLVEAFIEKTQPAESVGSHA
jgi:UDP-N-acetylglucosamine 2-epimerase (non-hydrolysing)